jgi:DNA-binding transcriptional ArsR family regulator
MMVGMVQTAGLDSPFAAIASQTRRALLDLLRGGEQSVSTLTQALGVSQPAVSQPAWCLSAARVAFGSTTSRPRRWPR